MFYVISPPEATDWSVDQQTVVGLLQRGWPGIAVEVDGGLPTRDVVWQITLPEGELEGSQDREGQAHYLNGPIETLARYAAWWRAQVPPTQPLVLYDETYTTVVPVNPGMTAEDILAALS